MLNARTYQLFDAQDDRRDVPKFRLDTWLQLPSLWYDEPRFLQRGRWSLRGQSIFVERYVLKY